MDLLSESREKSIQKNPKQSRPTYVQLPEPTTETREMSGLHSPPIWLLSEQPERQAIATGANRIPNYRLCHAESLHASQWACERKARAETVRHITKPLSTDQSQDLSRAVARLTRETNCCFLRSYLVAQDWNVSSIGFAPAHGDDCLALCATALPWRSEDCCHAGPANDVYPVNGWPIHSYSIYGDVAICSKFPVMTKSSGGEGAHVSCHASRLWK